MKLDKCSTFCIVLLSQSDLYFQINIESPASIMLHSTDLALKTLGPGWTRRLVTRRGGKRSDPEVCSPSGRRFRNFTQLRNFLERKCDQFVISQKTEIVLKDLFRIKSTECSVVRERGEKKKVPTKPSLTFLTPMIAQKKCKLILPKPSSASPEEGLLSPASSLQTSEAARLPPSCPPVIFVSPLINSSLALNVPVVSTTVISESANQTTTDDDDDCICTDDFVNTEDLLKVQENHEFEETETSIVASTNITWSADSNVLVDSDTEIVCEKVEHSDSGEEIVGKLFSDPGDKDFYINNFISLQEEDLEKHKETDNTEDELTEADKKHIDHTYPIMKLTDLDYLDLYYNYDLKISDEMLDKFIEITKHLYENEDDEIELV